MNFLIGLLTCAHSKHPSKQSPLSYPKLCPYGNQKHELHQKNILNNHTISISKSSSISSKPLSQISINSQSLSSYTNLLLFHARLDKKMNCITQGNLIGLLNASNTETKQMKTMGQCLPIGKDCQINSLKCLRPYSVDHLVIFWKQHNPFTIDELVESHQKTMIVFEDWAQIKPVLLLYQEHLLLKQGEYSLLQNQDRISFDIISTQNKIVLQFLDPQFFRQHLQLSLKNTLKIQLQHQHLQSLLTKITLNQYALFRKQTPSAQQLIQRYIRQIQNQAKLNLESQNRKLEQSIIQLNSNLTDRKDQTQIPHKNSADSLQILAQFFANNPQLKNKAFAKNNDDEDLMIFQFNNSFENQNNNNDKNIVYKTPKKIQKARKGRSKSSDTTFIPDQFLDDELFDKY